MTRELRSENWRWVLGMGLAAWLGLAACAGSPAQGAPGGGPNWVTSNQNISVEQLPPVRPTAAPAGPKVMSQAEAISAAPFAFGVPAWAPAGFQLQPQVDVISPTSKGGYASVNMDWQDAHGAAIDLSISQGAAGPVLLGAAGTTETIQLNGQPASLRHQTGLGADRLILSWVRGSLAYQLAADSNVATRDDLAHMAASVP